MPEIPQILKQMGGVRRFTRGRRIQRLTSIIISLVAVAILGYLVYRQKEILLSYPWQINPALYLLSFFVFSIDLFLVAIIWGWIMNTIGKRLDYQKHIRYYIISNIAKRIPGTLWYIASRAQFYQKEGIDYRLTSLASGIELAVSIMSGVLVSVLFAIPIVLNYGLNPLVLAGILLVGILLLHPRVTDWIFRLLKVEATQFGYQRTIQWLIAYVPAWIFGGIVLFIIANSFIPIPLHQIGYVIGSWSLVGIVSYLLFFSPSNLGVTEVGLSLLLANIMPAPIAVILAITTRIAIILYEIIWALIWLNVKSSSSR
ncbi:MAG TPA: hypothetical protein VIK64_05400 [Anaerolineales bacterium]